MPNYLLDTNVVSELIRNEPNANVLIWFESCNESSIFTSAISQAEMLAGASFLPLGKRRDLLIVAIATMFARRFTHTTLPFDANCASGYAFVTAGRKSTGRPISMADAQIASIALANKLTLVTRNTKDFEGIAGLHSINPWIAQG